MSEPLYVTMLGSFSIKSAHGCVDEHSNRMRKVWLLLAYLIYFRRSRITQNDLLNVIQGADNGETVDPAGRLKALLYRSRTMLEELYPDAGHQLIQRKSGTYCWESQSVTLDAEEFDRLCKAAAASREKEEKLALYRQALPLYQGDFLPKLSMEPWVMPVNAYFHQLYLSAANEALGLMAQAGCWAEAAALCAQALKIEPYSEEFYGHLMRCRMEQGDRAGALLAYEQMSKLLFDTFGVMPSEDSRKLYRQATKLVNDQTLPMDTITEQLRESGEAQGAMYCEYDFFRFLYQTQARAIARTGEVVHIALFSLYDSNRAPLPRKSLDRAMDNLQEIILHSLRKGDVVCRCSVSQWLLMLPQANYENSCAVCQRLIKAFYRQYPHSPAQLHFAVQPLEPMLPR